MTDQMLERARHYATQAGLDNVEFRRGLAERLPVADGWADVVISNGVLNLVPDKVAAYEEIPCAGWTTVIDGVGFTDLTFGDPVDTYAGASGEDNARTFGVYGYPFTARKPD